MNNEILKNAKSGKRVAGRKECVKYLEGGRLTRQQAIKAKCYDCNGWGESRECDIGSCSLFPYSPYNSSGSGKAKKGSQV